MVKFSLNSKTGQGDSASAPSKADNRNWYDDRYQAVAVQRNILALVTLVSLLGVLFSAIAVSTLTPLKSVEPFVIQVEDKTGVTQVVDPVQAHELTADEAVNRYFIHKYIIAHETYDRLNINEIKNVVRALSSRSVYFEYIPIVDTTNPESKYSKFLSGGNRSATMRSLSVLPQGNDPAIRTVQARITVKESSQTGERTFNQIVTLSFQYAKLELTTEDRYINPLGFQVVGYRVDEETSAP